MTIQGGAGFEQWRNVAPEFRDHVGETVARDFDAAAGLHYTNRTGRNDLVAAKVDAPNEALFQAINRPFVPYSLEEIVEGIRRFREGFTGRLALQMMFVEANKDHASEMAQLARELKPDEVQLNTPLRPSPVPPLSPEEMEVIEGAFEGLNVLNVYKAERPEVVPLEESETRRRRPKESKSKT